MTQKPLDCPFCGSEAELKFSIIEKLGHCWYVRCSNGSCLCNSIWTNFRVCKKQIAIDMWNTRALPSKDCNKLTCPCIDCESKGMVEKECQHDLVSWTAGSCKKCGSGPFSKNIAPKEGSSTDELKAAMTVIQDMCDHEKEIRQLASIHIGKHEAFGDSYGVPIISEVVELLIAKLSAKSELVPLNRKEVTEWIMTSDWDNISSPQIAKQLCDKFGTKPSVPSEEDLIKLMETIDSQGKFKIKYSPRPEIIKDLARAIVKMLGEKEKH